MEMKAGTNPSRKSDEHIQIYVFSVLMPALNCSVSHQFKRLGLNMCSVKNVSSGPVEDNLKYLSTVQIDAGFILSIDLLKNFSLNLVTSEHRYTCLKKKKKLRDKPSLIQLYDILGIVRKRISHLFIQDNSLTDSVLFPPLVTKVEYN